MTVLVVCNDASTVARAGAKLLLLTTDDLFLLIILLSLLLIIASDGIDFVAVVVAADMATISLTFLTIIMIVAPTVCYLFFFPLKLRPPTFSSVVFLFLFFLRFF